MIINPQSTQFDNKHSLLDISYSVSEFIYQYNATNILLIDVSKHCSFTNFFIIATCMTPLHIDNIIKRLTSYCKTLGLQVNHIEGRSQSGWVLIDLIDIVIHLMNEEARTFYDLEDMWSQGYRVVNLL